MRNLDLWRANKQRVSWWGLSLDLSGKRIAEISGLRILALCTVVLLLATRS
jgi:hypothetical protein